MKRLKVIVSVFIAALLFLYTYRPLGRKVSKKRASEFNKTSHFKNGKFINVLPASQAQSLKHSGSIAWEFLKGNPNRRPTEPIPFLPAEIPDPSEDTAIWFGHSALLLVIDGVTILTDPMFGKAPTPFPFFGNKRFSAGLPIVPDDFRDIDAVILSHDHYDHLDYYSIKKLKDKVNHFFVPLGVSDHLIRWGVPKEKIKELDWWEEASIQGVHLTSTPARHFSGRSLHDRNASLWSSWVIRGKQSNIFFSGDSGYGSHFKEIGERFGPFDLTFMECGQYDPRWASIHMLPEETVQAAIDVKSQRMIPIHWAGFCLSLHDWTDPIDRVKAASMQKSVSLSTPQIGEPVKIGSEHLPSHVWWK